MAVISADQAREQRAGESRNVRRQNARISIEACAHGRHCGGHPGQHRAHHLDRSEPHRQRERDGLPGGLGQPTGLLDGKRLRPRGSMRHTSWRSRSLIASGRNGRAAALGSNITDWTSPSFAATPKAMAKDKERGRAMSGHARNGKFRSRDLYSSLDATSSLPLTACWNTATHPLLPPQMPPNCKPYSLKRKPSGLRSKPETPLASRRTREMRPQLLRPQPKGTILKQRRLRTLLFRKIAATATSHTAKTRAKVSSSDRDFKCGGGFNHEPPQNRQQISLLPLSASV